MGGGYYMWPKVTKAHHLARKFANIGHGRAITATVAGCFCISTAVVLVTTNFNLDETKSPEWKRATGAYLKFMNANPSKGCKA